VKLFRFDGVDAAFDLLPLAARRALDHAGCKLSLEGFRSLTRVEREELVQIGSRDEIDVDRVAIIALAASPPAQAMPTSGDPSPLAADAEPSAVAKLTDTDCELATFSDTVNVKAVVPAFPSAMLTLETLSVGVGAAPMAAARSSLPPVATLPVKEGNGSTVLNT